MLCGAAVIRVNNCYMLCGVAVVMAHNHTLQGKVYIHVYRTKATAKSQFLYSGNELSDSNESRSCRRQLYNGVVFLLGGGRLNICLHTCQGWSLHKGEGSSSNMMGWGHIYSSRQPPDYRISLQTIVAFPGGRYILRMDTKVLQPFLTQL